ncbi:MAG: hypothetical protein CMJ46_03270 [Planctomyces sp.]|nr:hypothetical protein [Planctomyces sp.]
MGGRVEAFSHVFLKKHRRLSDLKPRGDEYSFPSAEFVPLKTAAKAASLPEAVRTFVSAGGFIFLCRASNATTQR